MDVRTLEATAVNTWLRAVRLPLSSLELVLRRQAEASWPPALLFEAFEAFVRERAGSVLRNEDLQDHARLQRAEITARRKAVAKRMEAASTSEDAQAEYEAERRELAAAKTHIDEQAARKRAQLERERRDTEQRVAREAAEKQAAAAEVDERRQKMVDEKARSAKAGQLDAEQKALAEKERALRAKERALELDGQVEQTKARRKAN